MSLLGTWGFVEVVPGRGVRVIASRLPDEAVPPAASEVAVAGSVAPALAASRQSALLDLEVKHCGKLVAKFMAEADPGDAADLRQLLIGAIRRRGGDGDITEYEMDIRRFGDRQLIGTFVASPGTSLAGEHR